MTRIREWIIRERTFVILSVLLVGSRLALIFCVEELWPSLERFYTGTIVKEMLDGMVMPIWDYQFSSYEAGWLLAAVFCYPIMKVVGVTSFGMALAGIAVYYLQFVIFYRILAKGVSPRAALFFGLQYLIAPHLFNLNALFLGFNYFNVVFLYAVFLALFFKIFHNNKTHAVIGDTGLSLFCLGLLGGFSTWTCYAFLLISVPCLVYWFVYHRSWQMKPVVTFLAGFALGISPLFFRIATFAGGIKADIVNRLITQDVPGFFGKFLAFLSIEVNWVQSVFYNYIELVGMALLASIVILRWDYFRRLLESLRRGAVLADDENSKILLFWLYPITFLTVFCLSDFNDWRYFAPTYPIVFICNALAIDLLMRHKNRIIKGLGGLALAVLLLFSVADSIIIPLYRVPPNLTLFRDKAYSYELLGCAVSWRFRDQPGNVMGIVQRLSDDEKRFALLRGFGFELAINGDEQSITKYVKRLASTYRNQPGYLAAYDKGLVLGLGNDYFDGTPMGDYYPDVLRETTRAKAESYFTQRIRIIEHFDPADKTRCFTGLGIQFSVIAEEFGLDAANLTSRIGSEYREAFLRGIKLGTTYSYRI